MTKTISSNTLSDEEHDRLFCLYGKRYGIKKLLLKAVACRESGFDERAFRHEPGFFTKYLKNHPDWKDRDPSEVSSSYGLMQLMYTTAHGLGYRGPGEGLYDPIVNIELGAKLLSNLLKRVRDKGVAIPTRHWEIEIALAWYNAGSVGIPDAQGKIRNQKYVDRVMETYCQYRKKEKECDESR